MTPVICPICGSENTTIFIHDNLADSKEFKQSGQIVIPTAQPRYHCNACENNFGQETTFLQNSTVRIDVTTRKKGEISQTITFFRTPTGVTFEGPFICYYPELPELYYDQETCSRFLKSFYELFVIDWKQNYGELTSSPAFSWDLIIQFKEAETFHSQGYDQYPPYWDHLMDLFVSFRLPNIKNALGDNFL